MNSKKRWIGTVSREEIEKGYLICGIVFILCISFGGFYQLVAEPNINSYRFRYELLRSASAQADRYAKETKSITSIALQNKVHRDASVCLMLIDRELNIDCEEVMSKYDKMIKGYIK